jgi:DNA-binding MarR family transcriptional regulator
VSIDPLRALLDALPNAFHRLGAAGDALHAPIGIGSGMRALMQSIERVGPTSVSRLAAMRPVSRQFVQRLVDDLLAGGWVEALPNPKHKRSPLIALTSRGRETIAMMNQSESPYLSALGDGLDPADLEAAVRILNAISDRLSPTILEQLMRSATPAEMTDA